ncbi:uncharacterized protein LOC143219043 [Lasioglossum baleicum]|uniref:uncharacterized protein LOC143219043 n=1 Tax=Lasioglossum baleicum TaxID=434251 RepID=UPI003FCD3134
MFITTNDEFVPKHFIICTFYGVETCFCWHEDKVVIFPYTNDDFVSTEVLTAPAPIKSIQCFASRIFFICFPHGVYKLSRDREFAVLSKSAIGMGTVFYEVLTPRNKYLYLDNKQNMMNKLLLQLSPRESDSGRLSVCTLNAENTTQQFMQTVTKNDSNVENLCILAIGKKILTLINETVQIVYNSIYPVRDIIPVQADSKIASLLLPTNGDSVVVMHSKDDTLTFEKIFLGVNVQTICAGYDLSTMDSLWLVYSDKCKLYYGKKQLLKPDSVQRFSVQDNSISCLRYYNPNIILGLTVNKELVEFPIDEVEKVLSMEQDTFIGLSADMLKGTGLIMDKIYKGTQEIHTLNNRLQAEEERLKRINLYAHKQKVQFSPNISLHRIANLLLLSVTFLDNLPKDSWVVFNVKFENETTFCMKKVEDQETVVDIYIPDGKTVNSLQVATDLITLKEEGRPWCLIRNYVIYPLREKKKRKKPRLGATDSINSKIAMLEKLLQDGTINMKTLSDIKRNVRRECLDGNDV